jgi:mRNA-degrading endonuclease RelE of RelBE toxin-antitoxin system
MNVKLSNRVKKQLDRFDAATRSQLLKNMRKLRKDPPEGDIKKIKGGPADYRLRSGDYRIFFDILKDRISVTEIFTRGHAYKNRR